MKRFITLLISIVMLLSLVACNTSVPNIKDSGEPSEAVNNTPSQEVVGSDDIGDTEDEYIPKVLALKGPTGMGMTFLMDEKADKYSIELSTLPDDVVSAFVSGNCDIAAVPINLASTLFNKLKGEVKMAVIHTLGVLYIVENGDTIKDIKDLAGKTIYATGQASTPEYILNYILEKNGLDDVKVEYVKEHAQLATMMAEGKVDIGMMPEPNVTVAMTKNKDLRIALDLTSEWGEVSDAELAQGCLIARPEFISQHPELMNEFLADYEDSVNRISSDKKAAAQSIADNGIVANAKIAEKAIDNCNIVFITNEKMQRMADAMFKVLVDANPKSIGGKLPTEDLYYIYK